MWTPDGVNAMGYFLWHHSNGMSAKWNPTTERICVTKPNGEVKSHFLLDFSILDMRGWLSFMFN